MLNHGRGAVYWASICGERVEWLCLPTALRTDVWVIKCEIVNVHGRCCDGRGRGAAALVSPRWWCLGGLARRKLCPWIASVNHCNLHASGRHGLQGGITARVWNLMMCDTRVWVCNRLGSHASA